MRMSEEVDEEGAFRAEHEKMELDDEDNDVWVVPPGSIASYLTHSLAMEIGSVNLSHLSSEQ